MLTPGNLSAGARESHRRGVQQRDKLADCETHPALKRGDGLGGHSAPALTGTLTLSQYRARTTAPRRPTPANRGWSANVGTRFQIGRQSSLRIRACNCSLLGPGTDAATNCASGAGTRSGGNESGSPNETSSSEAVTTRAPIDGQEISSRCLAPFGTASTTRRRSKVASFPLCTRASASKYVSVS